MNLHSRMPNLIWATGLFVILGAVTLTVADTLSGESGPNKFKELRFKQITACYHEAGKVSAVYALDNEGKVWYKTTNWDYWTPVTMEGLRQ